MPFLFLPDFSQKRTPGHSGGRGEAALPQRSSVDWRKWPQEGSDQASGFSTQKSVSPGPGLPQDQGWLSKHCHGILVLEKQPSGCFNQDSFQLQQKPNSVWFM